MTIETYIALATTVAAFVGLIWKISSVWSGAQSEMRQMRVTMGEVRDGIKEETATRTKADEAMMRALADHQSAYERQGAFFEAHVERTDKISERVRALDSLPARVQALEGLEERVRSLENGGD